MTPTLVTNDQADCSDADRVVASDILHHFSGRMTASYSLDLFICQLGVSMSGPARLTAATFAFAISCVVEIRPEEKMGRSNAHPIVATMKNARPVVAMPLGNHPVLQDPRKSMRRHSILSVEECSATIAFHLVPNPTSTKALSVPWARAELVDPGPKSLTGILRSKASVDFILDRNGHRFYVR